MAKKVGCPVGQVKGPDGKCHPGIKTKNWVIVKSAGDLQIYKDKFDLRNWRGGLMEEEGNWQPPSIQISQDHMNSMEESNVTIFFDIDDLKRRRWKNRDIPEAK